MRKCILLILMAIGLMRCDSEDAGSTETLSAISIDSSYGPNLVVDQTTQLQLAGIDQHGNSVHITSTITWASDNDHVSVDQDGWVTALQEGVSTITATTQGLSANYEISVARRVLSALTIQSPNGTLVDINQSLTLAVTGTDQINAPIAIESPVAWTASNARITIDQNGIVTGVSVGDAVVTAEVAGIQKSLGIKVWDSTAPRTEIYVSDVGANRNGPHQILMYDAEGQNGKVFIATNLSRPQDIVFFEDQEVVIVSNLQTNNITSYNSNTGAYLGVFASGINAPTRMQIGPDGLLYVIQWNGGPVKRYEQDGTFVDDFTSTSINQAIGIAWDSQGDLYVSSFNEGTNGFVRKYDKEGNDLGLFVNSHLSGPTDIWFDAAGNLLVSDWSANRVVKFSADGTYLSNFITGLNQPEGVAFLNDNILIGNSGDGSVKMYDIDGNFIKNLVSPGAAGLITTNAVTVRHVNQ